MASFPKSDGWSGLLRSEKAFLALALVAFAFGLARRLLVGWDAPLWFDEVYTGVIAVRPTFGEFLRDALNELSGPVYYGPIWAWEKVAGPGDTALRLPSLIFSVAAPAVALLWRGEDRKTRLIWAALIALWMPGYQFAHEARAYSFIFLGGTLQLIAFVELLRSPSTRRALAWTSISSLLILTHYHALIPAAFQGLAYLARHRIVALKTWPAALVFVPVVGWMSVHLQLVLKFSSAQVAWQPLLTAADLARLPTHLLGGGRAALLLVAAITATLVYDVYQRVRRQTPFRYQTPEMLAIGASILAIAVIIMLGFIRPSFTPRYLMPASPAVVFGLALWVRAWSTKWPWLPWLLVGFLAVQTTREINFYRNNPSADYRWGFSWGPASTYLQSNGAERVIFLIDNSTSELAEPGMLARAGGFFFHREGRPITVEPLILANRAGSPDPNVALLTAANRPRDGIMWIYVRGFNRTLAMIHPPRIPKADPSWACKDFGRGTVTVLACIRPQPTSSASRR